MATATDTARPASGTAAKPAGKRFTDGMTGDFLAGFMRLDIVRQLALMTGLAASVAIGFAVVLWSRGADYQPLYPDMNGYDMTQLVEILDSRSLPYTVEPSSGMLLVPSAEVAALRLQLAAAGVVRDTGYGYESLDQEQPLGTSQFMEASRYKRSQEGELQRTIMGFRNVQSARVHLATPERSVFVRNSRQPTASVFLTLSGGTSLSNTQVDAIANLVASSVPELMPDNVTIVDQRGNLLSRKDDRNELVIAGQQFDYARRYEDVLVERVNRILQPIVGMGRFSAEISADIDFTRSEQAAETYSPDGVLRSEQSLAENRVASDPVGGIPGALSNQPPATGELQPGANINPDVPVDAATVPLNTREQATRNYEVDRTISYTNHDPVAVRRLSVAVVLDDKPLADPGLQGEQTSPWTAEELEQITALLRDVVGYSAQRGDSVTVINNRFAPLALEDAGQGVGAFWNADWVASGVRQLGAVVLVLLLIFGVLRPVFRNLTSSGGQGKDLAQVAAQGEYADLNIDSSPVAEDKVTLSGGEEMLLPGPTEGYERQLTAIKGLIAQDPGRVAQVVKQWISDDV